MTLPKRNPPARRKAEGSQSRQQNAGQAPVDNATVRQRCDHDVDPEYAYAELVEAIARAYAELVEAVARAYAAYDRAGEARARSVATAGEVWPA